MKLTKRTIFLLACIALILLVLCIVLLCAFPRSTEAPAANPNATQIPALNIGGDTPPPDRSGEANAVYAAKKDYRAQLDNYFTALKTGDAAKLVGLYHPTYWVGGKDGLSDAIYLMESAVEELALPPDSTYTILREGAPSKDITAKVLSAYANLEISNIISLEVEYRFDGETCSMNCTFFEVDGGWYLYDDIAQLNY